MKQIISALVAIAIIAGVWFVTFGREQVSPTQNTGPAFPMFGPTTVVFGTVELAPFREIFRAIGTARAVENVMVLADVAGRIEEISISDNNSILEGAPLVVLERDMQRINARIAQSRLQQARDTMERYETLQSNSSGAISQVAVREASTALAIADAELALANEELERRVIRAPISGRLGLIDLERGDTLGVGDQIVTIDNTESMIVEFEMPERAVPLLTIGRMVSLHTPLLRGQPMDAAITAFDSRLDPVTRTVTVRAQIENRDGLLWPGMTLNVRMTQQSDPLPSVPAMAVTWSCEGARVWRVEGGITAPVPVVVRARIGDTVWLDADLQHGDQIVVEGVQKLRSGARVTEPRLAETLREPV